MVFGGANFFLYGCALALMIAYACISRDGKVMFAAGVTAANWFIWSVIVLVSLPDKSPWVLAAILDILTVMVFVMAANFIMAAPSLILVALHNLYGVGAMSEESYSLVADWVGRAQIALVMIMAVIAMQRKAAA